MAAKGGNRGDNGDTYVRFIMLETRGNASDLQQIAQAISQAVRPTIIQQAPTLPALPQNGSAPGAQRSLEAPHQPAEITYEEAEPLADPVPARKGPAKKRTLRTPEVLDLDLANGKVPFLDYYQEKNPADHSKRYLVIAAWFKLYFQTDEINGDHIYTCYRMLGLNVVADVGSIFRGCKKQGWFKSGEKPGWFAINHVGLNEVNNLSGGE